MRMDVGSDINVILSMIELEIRRLTHDRMEIYVRAVQPILWLLVFGNVLGAMHSIPTGGIPYIDYIMPGILIQSTTNIAILFGIVVIWERESGILKKLLASPASPFAVVLGRSMAAGTRALFQALFIIPFAMLIGVKVIMNPLYLLAALFVIFASASGFAAMSLMIAALCEVRERFMGLGQVIILPLFFSSSALYPISSMPPILQSFAKVNPMTYIVDATRALFITGNISQLGVDIVAILLFDVILLATASLIFKKIIE